MGIKIREGGFYRTRDGQKIGPVTWHEDAGDMSKWRAPKFSESWLPHWYANGRFGVNEHPNDLVAEWSDTPQHEGWTQWEGGSRPPVPGETLVEAKFRDGTDASGHSRQFFWGHFHNEGDILAYRVLNATPEKAEGPSAAGALDVKAGCLYLDAEGFVHGPMELQPNGVFKGGHKLYWRGDGGAQSNKQVNLVAEWVPPVPQHAAEENERLRQEGNRLTCLRDVTAGLWRRDINILARKLGAQHREGTHRQVVFDLCMAEIDKLKHDAEIHRDAAADAADDLRKVESRFLLALHAACVEAGVNVRSDDATDEEAVYGHLVNGIRALRRDIRLHEGMAEQCRNERKDVMLAEARTDAHIDATNFQLRALCQLVGRTFPDRLGHDQTALIGILVDGINTLVLNQRLMESEIASAEEKS